MSHAQAGPELGASMELARSKYARRAAQAISDRRRNGRCYRQASQDSVLGRRGWRDAFANCQSRSARMASIAPGNISWPRLTVSNCTRKLPGPSDASASCTDPS
jgi:hypothetical protein